MGNKHSIKIRTESRDDVIRSVRELIEKELNFIAQSAQAAFKQNDHCELVYLVKIFVTTLRCEMLQW